MQLRTLILAAGRGTRMRSSLPKVLQPLAGRPLLEHVIDVAEALGHSLTCYQSNAEHKLVDRVQKAAKDKVAFIVINPGAFTHTSVALRDALLAVEIPFIELHLSNTFAREEFRHNSYFSDIAQACLFGFGAYGYELAILAAHEQLTSAEDE